MSVKCHEGYCQQHEIEDLTLRIKHLLVALILGAAVAAAVYGLSVADFGNAMVNAPVAFPIE